MSVNKTRRDVDRIRRAASVGPVLAALPSLTHRLTQHALFCLLTAISAFKRPYLALDRWVQRSPHEIGLSPTVRAGNRHRGCWPNVCR
jgi:hypothetical protein